MSEQQRAGSRSVASIVGLVVGVIAIITSWMPIVNNISFVLAGVGFIIAAVGLVGVVRGKHVGKVLAVAALALNVIAIAIVLGTQSMYSAAIDDAVQGPSATASEPAADAAGADDETGEDGAASEPQTQDLAVGSSVSFENGVDVTVTAVTPGLVNYDGSSVIGVQVTYVNNSDGDAAYNPYDWKGRDAQGAATSPVYYSDASEELASGTLAPGGTVTGNIYFEGDSVSALYYASLLADSPSASWTIA